MFPFEFSKANELRLYRINVCLAVALTLSLAEDIVVVKHQTMGGLQLIWLATWRANTFHHNKMLQLASAEFLFTLVLPTFPREKEISQFTSWQVLSIPAGYRMAGEQVVPCLRVKMFHLSSPFHLLSGSVRTMLDWAGRVKWAGGCRSWLIEGVSY